MNLCQQLSNKLGEDGLQAVRQDAVLHEHFQACVHCQSLLQAYEALPELLDALPEHEPDSKLLELTDNSIQAGSAKAASVKPRWRPVAPALAASLVALCTIGLYSQITRYQEAPLSAQISETRQPGSAPGRQSAGKPVAVNGELAEFEETEKQETGRTLAEIKELGGIGGTYDEDRLALPSAPTDLPRPTKPPERAFSARYKLLEKTKADAPASRRTDSQGEASFAAADSDSSEVQTGLEKVEVTGSRMRPDYFEIASPVDVIQRDAADPALQPGLPDSQFSSDFFAHRSEKWIDGRNQLADEAAPASVSGPRQSASEALAEFGDDLVENERQQNALEIRRRVSERRSSLRAEAAQRGYDVGQKSNAPMIESDAGGVLGDLALPSLVDDISLTTRGALANAKHSAGGRDSDYYRRDQGAWSSADELANRVAGFEFNKDRNISQSVVKQKTRLKGAIGPDGSSLADKRPRSGGVDLNADGLGEFLVYNDPEDYRANTNLPGDDPYPDGLSEALIYSYESASIDSPSVNFFDQYATTDGLVFQQPKGYWANTYVPGDPEIRQLSARLAAWDRSALGVDGRLEQLIAPVAQPFDAPADNALALSLMADANAVDGPTRMRLQVGIQGIADRLGHRPSMNVGIVVDLPADATDSDRIAVRALLDALLKSRQTGDRFSLVFSGGPDELAVAPGTFRFGPLQVAKERVFGQRAELAGDGIKLHRALEIAAAAVRENDDPSQPLGSSSILLISAGDLTDIEQLTLLAHRQAADGVVLSVVPLGQRPDLERVERLVLAGLGNRRFLESPDQARQLVEAELHAASRAVARAVRLSIRLAPGVHLVEVIGSRRLADPAAQRVREIEQSMDRRLSINLGIKADRGEDEDGIQIVIPSIFAGDSLIILLDLVVDQAGPVAEVSLRYKDLVFLRNGVLGGQLDLPKGALVRGAGELAVMKSLLAHEFAASTRRAASLLGWQHIDRARVELARMHDLLTQARAWAPAWKLDPELRRDQQVLASYLKLLASPVTTPKQSILADSLRYAAWRKSHWPPKEWKP